MILAPNVAATIGTRYAVIVGDHLYSRECRYQIVVPLLRGDDVLDEPTLLRVQRQHWFAVFGEPTSSAVLVLPTIRSVWHRDDIAYETPFVIDENSLEVLEERLSALFGVETPRPS